MLQRHLIAPLPPGLYVATTYCVIGNFAAQFYTYRSEFGHKSSKNSSLLFAKTEPKKKTCQTSLVIAIQNQIYKQHLLGDRLQMVVRSHYILVISIPQCLKIQA